MRNITIILVIFALMFVGCDSTDDNNSVAEFKVTTVSTAPTLDGSGGDAAWGEATEYMVNVGESADYANAFGVVEVGLTAVKTASDLYIKAVWDDPSNTESVDKNQWFYENGAWDKSGNEDRFFIFFDMGQNGTDGTDCAAMCHTGGAEEGMWTSVGKVDEWHWKAARTAPINKSDDKYIDNNYTDSDGNVLEDAGHHGDSKTIGLYNNNKSNGMPKYSGPLSDGFLILPAGSDEGSYFTPFDTSATSGSYRGYWLNENADGSRANVTAYSTYSNGTWTVEFKRALNTGNADDAIFGSGTVMISVALTDNAGGDHSGAPPIDMIF